MGVMEGVHSGPTLGVGILIVKVTNICNKSFNECFISNTATSSFATIE